MHIAPPGGKGLIAANRPVYVARDDATGVSPSRAGAAAFVSGGFIGKGRSREYEGAVNIRELCAHPINFIVGGPQTGGRRAVEAACRDFP